MELNWIKLVVSSILLSSLWKYTEAKIWNKNSMLSPCFANADCADEQCCALRKEFFTTGFCLRRKSLGEICNPFIQVGKHFTCGCMIGLTCAVVEEDAKKNPKYRCVRVPTESPEMTEHPRHLKTTANKQKPKAGSPEVELLKRYLKKVKENR